jgi:hypothetical protein
MAIYEILATRFNGSQMVLSKSRPESIDSSFGGHLYDSEQDSLIPVGEEVFKAGYWQEGEGTIELAE